MKSPTHHIQKQELIFDFSTETKSRTWHKTASSFFYCNILPLLNIVFDQHFPEDQFFFTDRLEINLGTIEEDDFQEALLKTTRKELTRILKNKPLKKISKSDLKMNAPSGAKISVKNSTGLLEENFYYFLDHGILPWSSKFKNLNQLEAEIMQEIGIDKFINYPGFQKRLQQPETRRRLYFQFSRSFWEEVCNRVYKNDLNKLTFFQESLAEILILLAKSDRVQKNLRQELGRNVKDWIGKEAPSAMQDWPQHYIRWNIDKAAPFVNPVGESAICKKIIQVLFTDKRALLSNDATALVTVLKSLISSEVKPFNAHANAEPFPPEKRKQKDRKRFSVQEGEIKIKFPPENSPSGFVVKDQQGGKEKIKQDTTALSEYYINEAGVILTWPYLAHLFKHTGYLENKVFKDVQHQQRAIHLLAYVASGEEQLEEQELVIAKFLCGWPLNMPVVKSMELTFDEKNEADQMLQYLILNWSVLKNTSVMGLRDSFFSREGKLFREGDNWRLIIEQKSFDMLLEHLPYTISLIRLPWIKDILKVDWA